MFDILAFIGVTLVFLLMLVVWVCSTSEDEELPDDDKEWWIG